MTIIANGKSCTLWIKIYYTFRLQIIRFCLNSEACNENAPPGTCCFSHSDWLQEHAALFWLVIGTFCFIMICYSNILHSDWLQKHAASFWLVAVTFSFILIGYMKSMLFLSDGFKGTFCFILNGYIKMLLHCRNMLVRSNLLQRHSVSLQLVTEPCGFILFGYRTSSFILTGYIGSMLLHLWVTGTFWFILKN